MGQAGGNIIINKTNHRLLATERALRALHQHGQAKADSAAVVETSHFIRHPPHAPFTAHQFRKGFAVFVLQTECTFPREEVSAMQDLSVGPEKGPAKELEAN